MGNLVSRSTFNTGPMDANFEINQSTPGAMSIVPIGLFNIACVATYTWSSAIDLSDQNFMVFPVQSGVQAGSTLQILVQINNKGSGDSSSMVTVTSNSSVMVDITPITNRAAVTSLELTYFFQTTTTGPASFVVGAIGSTCFPGNTPILMEDMSEKKICDIQPGDSVVGCHGKIYTVARLIKSPIVTQHIEVVRFQSQCLGIDQPYKELVVSKDHPIFFQGTRKPAYALAGLNGVTHETVLASDEFGDEMVLVGGKDMRVSFMFNIQFEQEGSFVASGLLVQSHSPYHVIDPLPDNLFSCRNMIKKERTSDSLTMAEPFSSTPAVSPKWLQQCH